MTSAALAPSVGAADIDYAYVWANEPSSASYEASATYASAPTTITRSAPGVYAVSLGPILVGAGQTVLVTAYGPEARRCGVRSWAGGVANVTCVDAAGAPADSRFSLVAVRADSAAASKSLSYAWADKPEAESYAPSAAYAYNAGQPIEITRAGTGTYRVTFGDVLKEGRSTSVQATAYGAADADCRVVSWGGGAANVACVSSSGVPVNARFTILATRPEESLGRLAFAWANHPDRTEDYMPSLAYQHAASGYVTARRAGAGVYDVSLGAILKSAGATVQVSDYGSDTAATCQVVSWSSGSARVACFDRSARPKDARFVVMAVR